MHRPDLPSGIRRVFRLPQRKPRIDEDVSAEVAFHLEMRVAELVARGLSPEGARAEAERRFGDTSQWSRAMSDVDREHLASQRRTEWLDDLRQDLRFGVRAAFRAPLFSLLAVVTLALGIGANAAVFGVVKSVLLDALPYADADRLVRVHARFLDGSAERGPFSAGTVDDIQKRQRSFDQVSYFAMGTSDGVHAGSAGPRVVKIAWVDPTLFRTLGVTTLRGRPLAPDDAATDTAFNIVLSHATWQRELGGDPDVVGSVIRINGIGRTVVGVLPREFVGLVGKPDVYFPLSIQSTLRDAIRARRSHWLGVVGRLKPDVTVDVARRDLLTITAALAKEHPKDNGLVSATVEPMRDALAGDTRTPLIVLMASAALVLLITCANLAGALLSRALSRRKEFAVRVSLGAGRGRLVRQMLTESTVLAVAGGAAAIALAIFGLRVLRGLALPFLPAYADLSLDTGALVLTSLLALGTGLAFGVVPALTVTRTNVQGTLRDEARGASETSRSRRLRGLLVVGQIALCVSLLAGAGLLGRSLWAMMTAPLGLSADGVVSVAVELPQSEYGTPEARSQFMQEFEQRLRGLPGVNAVAISGELPTRVVNRNGVFPENAAQDRLDNPPFMLYNTVSGAFFRTLGIPLLSGRVFTAEDQPNTTPVMVVSESMARQLWPNGDAVGSRLRIGPDPNAPLITVVGIVGDVRNDPARVEPEPTMYAPMQQQPWNGPIFLLRTAGEPLSLVRPVEAALKAFDPSLPMHNAVTMRDVIGEALAGRRLPVVLMTGFGALALLLASVGVYAMFAAMAAAREREFGVRVALGSTRREIAGLVLRQGGVWMAGGLALGALGVYAVSRLVRGLLYGVQPLDPLVLGSAVLLLLLCAALALVVPIRRATRVDPIQALR